MARIAVILLFACALRAQSVDGTLVDSMSRTPIPNVIVTLLGPSRYNGTTDETGAFHIPGVKPGKYVLNIVKAGYVLPPERRAAFTVDADTRLPVEMDPLGRVEGRVRYFDGRPAPLASVWLNGVPAGSNLSEHTDLGGHFVFEDVKPGSYVVHAVGSPNDPKPEGEIWAPTWFPSTTDRASAEPIRVTYGVTAAGDIRLRSVPERRIRGMVRDDGGRPAAGATVTLRGYSTERTAVTAADGLFEFLLYDGEWRLVATRKEGEVELRGAAAVPVARHDVENADVRLARPFELSVATDRDDTPAGNGRQFPTAVMLLPADFQGGPLPRVVQGNLTGVYPGRYRIQPMLAPPNIYLESVKLGEIDAMNKTVEIWDGSQPVRIVYRQGSVTIRGVVEKGEGAVVVIVDTSENPRAVVAGADGSFQVGGLAPGDYYVLAFDHAESRGATDAAFWRPLLPRAERVHVERGGVAIVTLKPMPFPR